MSMSMSRSIRLLICLVVSLCARGAVAEIKVTSLRWVELPPSDARPDELPTRAVLRAVIAGASPGLRQKDMVVKVPESAVPVSIAARSSVPFSASEDKLSVLILVQGNLRFMGGPEAEGYLEEVKQAVDTIARARTRSTRVGLYVYGKTVIEKAPMGRPEEVSGELLGTQAEYAEVIDKALQRGIEEALRVLSNEEGRRVLFVIGDGGDQREDYSPRRDAERLEAAGIEVYVLGASPREPLGNDRRRLEALGAKGAFRYANVREQVGQLTSFLVNEMNNVYTVEFPDVQKSDGQMLPTDGGEHEVIIAAGTEESALLPLRFPGPLACLPGADAVKCVCAGKPPRLGPPCAAPEEPPAVSGWLWALLGTTLVGAGAAAVLILRRRGDGDDGPDGEAVPVALPELPMPVAPPPQAPQAFDPRKTRGMCRLDDESLPLVAWIVPVNGMAAFQTFRLNERTIIGAAPDCHVRIEDPHMSGHHAEIVLRDGSFVLVDRDSRNGIKFYDRTVTRHTLVDNDLFTCGETSFKFKSTGD